LKQKYGDQWEDKFRQTYEKRMIDILDTHFFVGTLHQHPNRWIIVGLFYPPYTSESGTLFDINPAITNVGLAGS
jgi:hypothetical protein